MAASAGVSEMYFWNMETNWGLNCSGTYMGHPVYGKMTLRYQINGGSYINQPSYNYYKKFINKIGSSVDAVSRVNTPANLYMYDVIKIDNSKVRVVWEDRDLFTGEDTADSSVTISVSPWSAVLVEDLWGNIQSPAVLGCYITINVDDTPIFITQASAPNVVNCHTSNMKGRKIKGGLHIY